MVGFMPVVLLAALATTAIGLPTAGTDGVLDLQNKGRPQLDAALAKSKTCTKDKLLIRREWGDMSVADRKAYIAAMQCIMKKPPKLTQFAGVTNRFEDFVAVHINQTLHIHGTGNFLSWHRYYAWSFEQALRTECNYNGTQPYWDYGRWAANPEASPIFDGSDSSLSGNGEKVQHTASAFARAGDGGGCVKTGPFGGMMVHLGPFVSAVNPPPASNPSADGMGKNTRCLRRDMTNYLTSNYGRTQDIVRLLTTNNNIGAFQTDMQSSNGVHNVGHFTIAGDPGGDFYASPNDPAFYVHHGMIDRLWSIWQTQDFPNRQLVISGGTNMMGGGRAQSLDDIVDLGVVAPGGKTYKIRDLVSTVDGPFCYAYE